MAKDDAIQGLRKIIDDDWMWKHADYYASLISNAVNYLESQPEVVLCKDCKYATYYHERFSDNYVCKKNMDKDGKIPKHDLKGHNGWWFCADGVKKE